MTALRVPVCAIVLNALGHLLSAGPDDGSRPVDNEAKTLALVEECQPIAPRILIHAALAQAGDLSLAIMA
jgi:hypothetical protein